MRKLVENTAEEFGLGGQVGHVTFPCEVKNRVAATAFLSTAVPLGEFDAAGMARVATFWQERHGDNLVGVVSRLDATDVISVEGRLHDGTFLEVRYVVSSSRLFVEATSRCYAG